MLQSIGLALHTLGEIFVAFFAVRVHTQVLKDRQIDSRVLKEMRREKNLVYLGIVLIITGFILELYG